MRSARRALRLHAAEAPTSPDFRMSTPQSDRRDARPPSPFLLMLEGRALAELFQFVASSPLFTLAPRGDGHTVMVLPGLGADDSSTQALRSLLSGLGYDAVGWELGRNRGWTSATLEGLEQRLADLAARSGRKVSLIGWSMGGIFARELARARPSLVRGVITLGSPFASPPGASNAGALYKLLNGEAPRGDSRSSGPAPEVSARRARMLTPPPVPATAIFSRSDGVVNWRGCREQVGPQSENVEVEGSHCGLGHNVMAAYVIADRLAQAEGAWRPFDRQGLRGIVYRDPYRDGPDLP